MFGYSSSSASIPKVAFDVLLWIGASSLAVKFPFLTPLAFLVIGAVAMHDLLVHGHEAVHRHVTSCRWINEFVCWLTHALCWLSGSAYRSFHLDHHRYLQTERDPEIRFLNLLWSGAPGWAYFTIPLLSHLHVNTYPFRSGKTTGIRLAVIRDLAGALILHGAIAAVIGLRFYILFVVAPMFTSLSLAVIVRSVTEHHHTESGDRWRNARSVRTSRLLEFLWSNTNYHLEHHLYPAVPFDRLPEVHRAIAADAARHGSPRGEGYLRTAPPLLVDAIHVRVEKEAR